MSVRKLLDLAGKTAIVTGGSRGIGLQMALALGEMGARVALTREKGERARRVAAPSSSVPASNATRSRATSRKFDTIPGVVSSVLERWGRIDILVNNAAQSWGAPAGGLSGRRLAQGDESQLSTRISSCARSRQAVDAASPERQDHQHRLDRGLYGNPPGWQMQTIAYNTSKGALIADTRTRRRMGAAQHQRQCDLPRFLSVEDVEGTLERIGADVIALTPLGRLGGDEDLKGSVVFLARRHRVTSRTGAGGRRRVHRRLECAR
jgi:gluconate 5-dehydrogenase